MNIYRSGQILGQPIDQVAAIFEAAASTIRCAGHNPINPLDLPEGTNFYEVFYKADALYLLHNYQLNIMSRQEEASAIAVGLKIFYETNPADFWNCVQDYNERGKEALIDNMEGEVW